MKALIIAGKYSQDVEVFYALYRLDEDGWDVDLATLDGKETHGVYGMPIRPTRSMRDWNRIDLLILTGGARALEYLRQDAVLLRQIRFFHEQGGAIGSVCHGAQLLISAGLVKGRMISGYYSIKHDIENAGGTFVDAPFVTDGRIVTCPHYKHMGPWMKEVLRVAYG